MNKTALVTDLKVIDSPQAGIGVSRCLKDAGFVVLGADDTPLVTSNSNLFKEVFCWEEMRTLNFDSLIKKITNIKEIYGLEYIFPCYDETAILFSFVKDKLDYLKIKLIAPPRETIKAIQKVNLPNIAKTDNFITPKTKIVFSREEAVNSAELIGYPVVCKGLIKGNYVCKNENDLAQNIKKLSDIWNGGNINCIIQKFINDEFEEYRNCIIGIKDNRIAAYVEMKKIGIDQNGATWFGKIEKAKELFPFAEHLTSLLPFGNSIIEVETIEVNNIFYIYEINPRSPAWIYAPCQLGLNIPKIVTNNSISKIKFIKEEGYFGRETNDFIRKDIKGFENNIKYYSKGVAYKSEGLKYPSELL